MTIGRKVKRPSTTRLGVTNTHPMRGTPSRRCSARIGSSTAFSATVAIATASARNGRRNEASIAPAPIFVTALSLPLFAGRLHLLIDVGGDPLHSIVETHFSGNGLAEARRGGVEQRAVVLVALNFIGNRGQLRDIAHEYLERRVGLRRDLVIDAFLREPGMRGNVFGLGHV